MARGLALLIAGHENAEGMASVGVRVEPPVGRRRNALLIGVADPNCLFNGTC
jgi:hypothetical protein